MSAPLFAVPDLEGNELDLETLFDDGDGDGPDDGEGLGDLPYLAMRLLIAYLAKIDWKEELSDAARLVTATEEDAQDVLRLVNASTIEVVIGDIEGGVLGGE